MRSASWSRPNSERSWRCGPAKPGPQQPEARFAVRPLAEDSGEPEKSPRSDGDRPFTQTTDWSVCEVIGCPFVGKSVCKSAVTSASNLSGRAAGWAPR